MTSITTLYLDSEGDGDFPPASQLERVAAQVAAVAKYPFDIETSGECILIECRDSDMVRVTRATGAYLCLPPLNITIATGSCKGLGAPYRLEMR